MPDAENAPTTMIRSRAKAGDQAAGALQAAGHRGGLA